MKLFLNCEDNEITLNKKQYLLRATERLGITNVFDIKRREGDEPTDYILNIEPYSFKKGNKWTGVWEIDLLCDRQQTGTDWPYVDAIFLAGMSYASRLHGFKNKIHYLFQACDPLIHKKVHTDNIYDFVQCGSMTATWHDERNRLVTLLREKYSFVDYGKDYKPEQYIKNISSARIQFIRSMKSGIADGEIAQRFFECLALGPVLTNYVKDLDYLGLDEGIDYFSYKNDYEMLTKFQYLIQYPNEALKMAENGRRKALMLHTYEHRLISILNILYESTNK